MKLNNGLLAALLMCAVFALSGCGAIQGGITKVESDIASKVDQAVSFPDLENAKIGAQQLPEPQRSEAIQCFTEQEDYLHQVEAALAPPPASTAPPAAEFNPLQLGLATGAIDLQLAAVNSNVDLKQLLLAKVPPPPRQMLKDCAPVYLDTKLAIAKMGMNAAALAASVGNVGAAVKLKKGAAALKAEGAVLSKEAAALQAAGH